jgi:hypothetical protein
MLDGLDFNQIFCIFSMYYHKSRLPDLGDFTDVALILVLNVFLVAFVTTKLYGDMKHVCST